MNKRDDRFYHRMVLMGRTHTRYMGEFRELVQEDITTGMSPILTSSESSSKS